MSSSEGSSLFGSSSAPGASVTWSDMQAADADASASRGTIAAWVVVGVCIVIALLVIVLWLSISNAQRLDNGTASDETIDDIQNAVSDAEVAAAQAQAALDTAGASIAIDAAQQQEIDALQSQMRTLQSHGQPKLAATVPARSFKLGRGGKEEPSLEEMVAEQRRPVKIQDKNYLDGAAKPLSRKKMEEIVGRRATMSMTERVKQAMLNPVVIQEPMDALEVTRRSMAHGGFDPEEHAHMRKLVQTNKLTGYSAVRV